LCIRVAARKESNLQQEVEAIPARDWAHRAAELRAWRRVRREKDDTILEQGVKKSVRSTHVLTALFAGARNGGACGDAAGGFGTRNQRR